VGGKMKIKQIIIGVLCGLFLIILLQNTQVVEFRILFWKFSMSRVIMFLLTLLLGFGMGFLTAKLTEKKIVQSKG
jgi:uncharacterized integral membrane protein